MYVMELVSLHHFLSFPLASEDSCSTLPYTPIPREAVVSLNSLFLWLLMEIGHWRLETGKRDRELPSIQRILHTSTEGHDRWPSPHSSSFQVSGAVSLPCTHSLNVVIDSHCCLH